MQAKSGIFRQVASAISLAGLLTAAPSYARERTPFRVADGTLATAARTIASETGAEIVSLEPGFASQPVRGRLVGPDAAKALGQILRHTPFKAISLGGNGFRIVRRPRPERLIPAALPRVDHPESSGDAIVVEGKFPTRLANYPGSVSRIDLTKDLTAMPRVQDFGDFAKVSPVLSNTAFGDGREKIFIRGVADSSFNGAAQPTTSIYFGDALIGFGSPNPNLRLYDVASVEVLEGPQGTLYGSGSVGGVIRIIPNAPNLTKFSGSITAAVDVTAGGQPGRFNVGVLNAPLQAGRLGLRLVAYDERSGGYIDDRKLGQNLNRVAVSGTRLSLGSELAGQWYIDASAIYQRTSAQDSQYADRSGPLQRIAAISEPYQSDLALGMVSLKKRWPNGIELNSAASIGRRTAVDRFDATAGQITGRALEIQRNSIMWSSETRLSGETPAGLHWVGGIALDSVKDGQSRAYGLVDAASPLDEVTNLSKTASVFAQGRIGLWPQVELTAGLRYSLSRTDSRPARNGQISYIGGKPEKRFNPTLALLWHTAPGLALYARFQTGYRNGGVTVARGVGRVASFDPDSIMLGEVGARYTALPGLTFASALSYAHWSNVLGDLVTLRGTPISTNLGPAKIFAFEASANWDSGTGWSLGAAVIRTDNRITGEIPLQSAPKNRMLPSAPKFSATANLRYTAQQKAGRSWSAGLNAQYVGRSVLGSGPLLDISQGQYANVDFDARLVRSPVAFSLQVTNLLNSQANRFALGNPLTLYRRDGYVPVRPRTGSLAVTINW